MVVFQHGFRMAFIDQKRKKDMLIYLLFPLTPVVKLFELILPMLY